MKKLKNNQKIRNRALIRALIDDQGGPWSGFPEKPWNPESPEFSEKPGFRDQGPGKPWSGPGPGPGSTIYQYNIFFKITLQIKF